MAEEHRFQAQRLCANNCGFFGNPTTQNLCSKCFQDLQLKEQQSNSAKHAFNQTLASASISSSSQPQPQPQTIELPVRDIGQRESDESTEVVEAPPPPPQQPNRCLTCRRRVGLTAFKCRCGSLFCGTHRYPEQHGCSFDFKGMGKEQIAKANPLVKSEKLEKI